MPANTLTKQQVRTIALEIDNGRGSHCAFVRAWAHAIVCANESNMDMMRNANNHIIDYYHLAGYLQPLGSPQNGGR